MSERITIVTGCTVHGCIAEPAWLVWARIDGPFYMGLQFPVCESHLSAFGWHHPIPQHIAGLDPLIPVMDHSLPQQRISVRMDWPTRIRVVRELEEVKV